MSGITRLPTELVLMIAYELDPVDLFNFAHTCRSLLELVQDPGTCRRVLKVGILGPKNHYEDLLTIDARTMPSLRRTSGPWRTSSRSTLPAFLELS
jgi:hypothetical protein